MTLAQSGVQKLLSKAENWRHFALILRDDGAAFYSSQSRLRRRSF
jgi:hypothetical protein